MFSRTTSAGGWGTTSTGTVWTSTTVTYHAHPDRTWPFGTVVSHRVTGEKAMVIEGDKLVLLDPDNEGNRIEDDADLNSWLPDE